MVDVIEVKEGVFEYTTPQEISAEQWLNEHLDCNAIVDNHGDEFVIYAFTLDPKYNIALREYKDSHDYSKQYLLRGISSDGLNGLFQLYES